MQNPVVQLIKDMVREPVTFPGGYTKVLYMADGEMMCQACTKENFSLICRATRSGTQQDSWKAYDVDIYWDGAEQHCGHCNGIINSEYGDPEAA